MVTKTKRDKTTWTLASPATPEMIDEYFNDFRSREDGEVANAARESARAYCQGNAKALREFTTDGKENYKIDDMATDAIPYVEGFEAGVCWGLKRVMADYLPHAKS